MLHYMVYDKIIAKQIKDVELRQVIFNGLIDKSDYDDKTKIDEHNNMQRRN